MITQLFQRGISKLARYRAETLSARKKSQPSPRKADRFRTLARYKDGTWLDIPEGTQPSQTVQIKLWFRDQEDQHFVRILNSQRPVDFHNYIERKVMPTLAMFLHESEHAVVEHGFTCSAVSKP